METIPQHILSHFPKGQKGIWKDIPDEKWNDWKWQLQNRIRDLQGLMKVISLTKDEIEGTKATLKDFHLGITPYYAALMDKDNDACPIRKQSVPSLLETRVEPWDLVDPLAEDRDSPVKGITHRYPDRVLFYITPNCPVFCRHCTRKRKVSKADSATNEDDIKTAIRYISEHKEIRDVVISGGDPLTFSDSKLEKALIAIRNIPHVEIIRIGTRVPVTLPQRITTGLLDMLRRYHPIYINTHFNHPKECTLEAFKACNMIADAGIPIGNQMVLLKGINDDPNIVVRLNQLLLMMRVKPYYIYICDMARGVGHFRTTLEAGLKVMEALRGWTSGLAVPQLVIDAPGGGGKIPILPAYIVEKVDRKIMMRNYRGSIYTYIEPD